MKIAKYLSINYIIRKEIVKHSEDNPGDEYVKVYLQKNNFRTAMILQ